MWGRARRQAGICGSDVQIYKWSGGYEFIVPSLPVTLGHELAGRVCPIGPGVKDLTIGQGVIVIPFVTCDVCPSCRAATTTIAWTGAASG